MNSSGVVRMSDVEFQEGALVPMEVNPGQEEDVAKPPSRPISLAERAPEGRKVPISEEVKRAVHFSIEKELKQAMANSAADSFSESYKNVFRQQRYLEYESGEEGLYAFRDAITEYLEDRFSLALNVEEQSMLRAEAEGWCEVRQHAMKQSKNKHADTLKVEDARNGNFLKEYQSILAATPQHREAIMRANQAFSLQSKQDQDAILHYSQKAVDACIKRYMPDEEQKKPHNFELNFGMVKTCAYLDFDVPLATQPLRVFFGQQEQRNR